MGIGIVEATKEKRGWAGTLGHKETTPRGYEVMHKKAPPANQRGFLAS
jgi:hypothetical protein